jgi:hypothetical protein
MQEVALESLDSMDQRERSSPVFAGPNLITLERVRNAKTKSDVGNYGIREILLHLLAIKRSC